MLFRTFAVYIKLDDMKLQPPEKLSASRIASFCAFAVVVALFMFVSPKAGMRGLGVSMLVGDGVQAVTGRIPYGIEGREPSGYISGPAAVLLSLLMGLVGVAMIAQPELMLALFGWAAE
jgi:hypothetical protein